MIPQVDHTRKPGILLIPFEILALLISIYQLKIGKITNGIIIIGLVIAFLVAYLISKKSK